MNKLPVLYTEEQLSELEAFTENNIGSHYDGVMHEIVSEYVHSDVFAVKRCGFKAFVTRGMGARAMNSPTKTKRCELMLSLSEKTPVESKESVCVAAELTRMSKFPFKENTWFGNGHTMDTSKQFREIFGYSFLAFRKIKDEAKLSEIDEKINFLEAIPIYEEERNWCVENSTNVLIDRLYEKYGDDITRADFKREMLLPEVTEDELFDYQLMSVFGIDFNTLQKLYDYIEECEEKGIELEYEDIEKWVTKNI